MKATPSPSPSSRGRRPGPAAQARTARGLAQCLRRLADVAGRGNIHRERLLKRAKAWDARAARLEGRLPRMAEAENLVLLP